jgi:hypothetical protein
MWARLDDGLLDHPKISIAGRQIGTSGRAIAIGFYAMALMWSNKQLSDGFIPSAVLETFAVYVKNPVAVADALVAAGLFERDRKHDGYRIHDYADHGNPTRAEIKRKREKDRLRKALERANGS